ncbi:MAG TPA: glycosyltransferase family 2 protein [Candidatus Hydrogenedentes bacterium]|nr:glycosyltransferase family 2 protein [Candidatus Hydrogenedentota bacterium]
MSAPTLSVVIPSWNHGELLSACLRSLIAQSRAADEIIVVDDGSSPPLAELVAEISQEIRVIRLAANSGFCVAVNTGIRAASGDFVFLLNNDMTLEPDALSVLLDTAESQPNTLLTPLVLFESERNTVYAAGDRVLANGRPESIGYRAQRASLDLPPQIFGVTGGAALIPRAVFRAIGYFDEKFIAYFEDADFCMRARLAGYTCALAPQAVAYHVGSASQSGKTWWRSRQCFRNHALLLIKNFPGEVIIGNFSAMLRERLHQAGRVISSARVEFGLLRACGVLLGAIVSLWAALPQAMRERRMIQRARTITAQEFASRLTPPDALT